MKNMEGGEISIGTLLSILGLATAAIAGSYGFAYSIGQDQVKNKEELTSKLNSIDTQVALTKQLVTLMASKQGIKLPTESKDISKVN